jgi:TatD DNase family protein
MSIELFDTHCHLNSGELFEARQRVVADALEAGVSRLITVACKPDEFGPGLSLRNLHAGLYVAIGIHPHEAAAVGTADVEALPELWREARVVAAGEMGLDYHYDFSPRLVQRQVFERQLELVRTVGLPVVIHCREAQAEVIEILLAHGFAGQRVVFHCFSGTPQEAAEVRAHGWWTSFTGLITFKNATGPRQAMLDTPVDQLMFETDSPYLSPEPVRRMRPNEPRNVLHTVRFAAGLRGESFEELAQRTTRNAMHFFGISE